MKRYLYLNLIPEALVASMLPPQEYGKYLAVGVHSRTNQQAIFAELDAELESDYFPLEEIEKRCVPHSDGAPRKSTYISIYRVLEHVPLSALKALYLVTDDGRLLELQPGDVSKVASGSALNLYQELAPMQPVVASSLSPLKFCETITDRKNPVSVEKIAFCDLKLDDLETDPVGGLSDNLPYKDIPHLRDCLHAVWLKGSKDVKVVNRRIRAQIFYRMIKSGFYIGGGKELVYYPFPSIEELESTHYEWWRSAQF